MTDITRDPVATFIRLDRVGAVLGIVFVVAVNGLVVRQSTVWLVLLPLVALVGCLTLAARRLERDLSGALLLVGIGNAVTAVVVATMFPSLWPVMSLTVLMPLVLATPYLADGRLLPWLGATVLTVGLVGLVGLLNDDGGVLTDLDDDLELWLVVGALAAQSIPFGLIVQQNNRLQRRALDDARASNVALETSRQELEASRRRVVAAADEERARIERDLHDGAQSRLVAVAMRLRLLAGGDQSPEEAAATAALLAEVEEATAELRELSHGLYPPLLESQGLAAALRTVVRRFEAGARGDLVDVGRLPRDASTALYFTCLEALANTAKHAPGARAEVVLRRDGDEVVLVVSDDGPGFSPAGLEARRGLTNIEDRLAAARGTVDVDSAPGRGTTVTARVPAPPPSPGDHATPVTGGP